MDYNDLLHEATFAGGVQVDGTMGEVRGQRATVFLTPATKAEEGKEGASSQARQTGPAQAGSATSPAGLFGGSLDRVVVSGDVRMEQPGRQGLGEQLLYTAATGKYVLTGSPEHPPRIVDAQQGSVTGAILVFSDAGSTIVVAGGPGAKSGSGRVRTETEVRQ
jgi:lipopolysaccharide export system protein LptA